MNSFTPAAIMEMGYQRIKSIADRHGINSPETLAACERWGGILDDVNYPDSTCSHCGHPVGWLSEQKIYTHKSPEGKMLGQHCKTHAGAVAEPVKVTESGVAYIPTEAQKPWKLGDSEPVERKVDESKLPPVKPRNVIKK